MHVHETCTGDRQPVAACPAVGTVRRGGRGGRGRAGARADAAASRSALADACQRGQGARAAARAGGSVRHSRRAGRGRGFELTDDSPRPRRTALYLRIVDSTGCLGYARTVHRAYSTVCTSHGPRAMFARFYLSYFARGAPRMPGLCSAAVRVTRFVYPFVVSFAPHHVRTPPPRCRAITNGSFVKLAGWSRRRMGEGGLVVNC